MVRFCRVRGVCGRATIDICGGCPRKITARQERARQLIRQAVINGLIAGAAGGRYPGRAGDGELLRPRESAIERVPQGRIGSPSTREGRDDDGARSHVSSQDVKREGNLS